MSQLLLVVEKRKGVKGRAGVNGREGPMMRGLNGLAHRQVGFYPVVQRLQTPWGQAVMRVLEAVRGKEMQKGAKRPAPQGHGLGQEGQLGCSSHSQGGTW